MRQSSLKVVQIQLLRSQGEGSVPKSFLHHSHIASGLVLQSSSSGHLVLVLAEVEIIFLPVAAVFWTEYEKKGDNTLMLLVVDKK